MFGSWLGLGIICVLTLVILALKGLSSILGDRSSSAPGKNSTDELERLREIIVEHESRLRVLEREAGTAKPISSAASSRTPSVKASSAPAPAAVKAPAVKRNLEEAIGGRWFQWIALAALLFGLGYFLKLAFENNWIGPMGRVALGWVSGIVFLVWGYRWFGKYPVWAQSLAGGGLGFLYLSTYASFQFYHLLDSETAFGLMIITTMIGTGLSMAGRNQVVAALALLGGYLTPILVSTGENHQVILMSYLLILNLGVFFISVFGDWRFLRWGGAFFTFGYCVGWVDKFYRPDDLWVTLGFHTVFYLLFAFASWSQDFEKRKDTDSADALFCVLSAGIYFASSYALLTDRSFQGNYDLLAALLALALSGLYAWQSARFLRSKNAQSAYLSNILLGLSAAFFAAAIPAYFNKGWITVGWSVEAAFLVWAGLNSSRTATRLMGYAVLALTGCRLVFFDWQGVTPTLFWNERLITYGTALGSVVAVIVLLSRWKPKAEEADEAVPVLAIAGNLVALIYLSLEVSDYWNRQTAVSLWNAKALSLSVLWLLYAGGMMAAGFIQNLKGLRLVAMMTLSVTILKVFLYDLSALQGGYRVLSLIILGLILLAVSFAYQKKGKKGSG